MKLHYLVTETKIIGEVIGDEFSDQNGLALLPNESTDNAKNGNDLVANYRIRVPNETTEEEGLDLIYHVLNEQCCYCLMVNGCHTTCCPLTKLIEENL